MPKGQSAISLLRVVMVFARALLRLKVLSEIIPAVTSGNRPLLVISCGCIVLILSLF